MFQKNGKISKFDYEKDEAGSGIDTVVGPSVVVEGDFASQGNITVKGIVSGNVKTSEHLAVEEGAKIMANVKAGSAIIAGEVRGNIKVKGTLELKNTARVLGDVESGVLIVSGGAGLCGKCNTTSIDFANLKTENKKEDKKFGALKKKKFGENESFDGISMEQSVGA